jgi:hypothetical protein
MTPFPMNYRVLVARFGLIFLLAGVIYGVMAGQLLTRQSIAPHFVYLAGAWLEGRSSLGEPLPSTYDLIRYEGLWYVAQPPLPALVMLPLAALRGAAHTPEVLVSVLLGALNVALCDLTLTFWARDLSPQRRAWLTLFFALGTAHGYMSALGTVWFLGQISAISAAWLVLMGLQRWPWLIGLGLGGLVLARPTTLLGMLIVVMGYLWLQRKPLTLPKVGIIAAPLLLALLFLGWYNNARFGSPSDFGYQHVQDAPNIRERRLEHGSFSPVFLPDNLYTATVRPPLWENGRPRPDPWGMGLLWLSPVLCYAFWARWRNSSTQLIGLGVGLVMLFPLTYHNSGSAQFGYRFILDGLPLLMVLLAQGAQVGSTRLLAALTTWSIALYTWGWLWLFRLLTGQPWP